MKVDVGLGADEVGEVGACFDAVAVAGEFQVGGGGELADLVVLF